MVTQRDCSRSRGGPAPVAATGAPADVTRPSPEAPSRSGLPAAGPAPYRAAAPAGRDQGCAGGARPGPLRLAAPGAQDRAAATGRACGAGQIPALTSCPGRPASRPSRMLPQSGLPAPAGSALPRPQRPASLGDVRAPRQPRGCLLPSAPDSSWVTTQAEVAEAPVVTRPSGGLPSGPGPFSAPRRLCFASGSDRRVVPCCGERRSDERSAILRRSSAQPRLSLSGVHSSGGEATLPLLGPGHPGSIGSRSWRLGRRRWTQTLATR
ncbi:predicted GPI-anchored protein 58 [Phacochoerus africanus]|uniref:predicted GPI-anchored protein 58 n=1 Tax=Phacochoerus africanus TaxID=41426 RepID=UPI001FD94B1A|nr:predicted GPI-anchored protein 58 [Phacochoerus africanus]